MTIKLKVSLSDMNSILSDSVKYLSMIESIKESIKKSVDSSEEINKELSNSNIDNGNLLIALHLYRPLVDFNYPLVSELVFDYSDINQFDTYYDKVIEKISNDYPNKENIKMIMQGISWGLNELTKFSSRYILKQRGITIDTFDITRLADENEKFKETLEFTHKERTVNVQNIQEKIKMQNDNADASVEEILNSKKNNLKTLIKSGAGINRGQLAEVINNVGFKPDIRGKVITTPIDSSFAKGLNTIAEFNTDAIGARKALITSKTQVKQSGYLNRKISVLTEDIRINEDVEDCGTKHYLSVLIKDKKHLMLFENRFRVSGGVVKIITANDLHLIGKTIHVRSPITCILKDHNHVCKTCYGNLWKINVGLNIGTIANLILTEPMTQKLLSTKHLLKVKIENFDWDKKFFEIFTFDGNYIIPVESKLSIFIEKEDLSVREKFNVNRYRTNRIFLMDKKNKRTYLESPVPLIIPDDNFSDISDFYKEDIDSYEINFGNLNNFEYMFRIVINNTGVADPLLNIKNTLESTKYIRETYNNDYNQLVQGILGLLLESGTSIMSIHLEVIIACMTFFNNHHSEDLIDPDILLDIVILDISNAIYRQASPVKSLQYQFVTKQLKTDNFNDLFNKNGTSEFDRLFIQK